MLSKEQEAQIAAKVDQVENPDWYLEVLAMAMEDAGDDFDAAFAVAERAYDANPQPPASDADKALKRVTDTLAVHSYEPGE